MAYSTHYRGAMDAVTPRGTGATLASLLDMTNAYLAHRLEGLTDEEWLWEPVPGCWSIRDGKIDFAIPVPSPAPFTTIAWRLAHLHACNDVELHWLRDEDYEWTDVKVPSGAEEAVKLWRQSASDVREVLAALSDLELEAPTVSVRAGRSAITKRGLPRIFFASSLVRENIHHGAEVGVLRDLYRSR